MSESMAVLLVRLDVDVQDLPAKKGNLDAIRTLGGGPVVELIVELVELVVCLHEAGTHKESESYGGLSLVSHIYHSEQASLPVIGLVARTEDLTPPALRILRSIQAFRPMKRSTMKAKTAAHVWFESRDRSALNMMLCSPAGRPEPPINGLEHEIRKGPRKFECLEALMLKLRWVQTSVQRPPK